MNVVIVGCGRIGAQLAALLALEAHTVAVVDRNPHAFERLPRTFRGERIVGIGFDRDVLCRAGIERADAFVAATDADNTNIAAVLLVRRTFHVPKIVARSLDPERADIYRRLGIATIATTTWAANELKELLMHAEVASRLTLGNGEIAIVELELPPTLVDHAIQDLTVPGKIMVTAIVRQGKGLVPFPGARFQAGDMVYLTVLRSAMVTFKELVGLA